MSDHPMDPRVSLLPQPDIPAPIQPMSGGSMTGGAPDPTVSLLPQPQVPAPIQPMSGGGSGASDPNVSLLPQPAVPAPIIPVQGGGAAEELKITTDDIPANTSTSTPTFFQDNNFQLYWQSYYDHRKQELKDEGLEQTTLKSIRKDGGANKYKWIKTVGLNNKKDVEMYVIENEKDFITTVNYITESKKTNKYIIFILNNTIDNDVFQKIYIYFLATAGYHYSNPNNTLDFYLLFDYSTKNDRRIRYSIDKDSVQTKLENKKMIANWSFVANFLYMEPFYIQLSLLDDFAIFITFRVGMDRDEHTAFDYDSIQAIYLAFNTVDEKKYYADQQRQGWTEFDLFNLEDYNTVYDILKEFYDNKGKKKSIKDTVIFMKWQNIPDEYFQLNFEKGLINNITPGDVELPFKQLAITLPLKSAPLPTQAPAQQQQQQPKTMDPIILQKATYANIIVNGVTYRITDPRKTPGILNVWGQGKIQEEEREFLESIGYTEEFYKYQVKKKNGNADEVNKELSQFLTSLIISSCNNDTNLLLKSECEITRKILMEIYLFKQASFLKNLYTSMTGSKRKYGVGQISFAGKAAKTQEEIEAEERLIAALGKALQALHSPTNRFPELIFSPIQQAQALQGLFNLQGAAIPFPLLGFQVPTPLQMPSSLFGLSGNRSSIFNAFSAISRAQPAVLAQILLGLQPGRGPFPPLAPGGIAPPNLPQALFGLQNGRAAFPNLFFFESLNNILTQYNLGLQPGRGPFPNLMGPGPGPGGPNALVQLLLGLQPGRGPFPNLMGPGPGPGGPNALVQLLLGLQPGRGPFPNLMGPGAGLPQAVLQQLNILLQGARVPLPTLTTAASTISTAQAIQTLVGLLNNGRIQFPQIQLVAGAPPMSIVTALQNLIQSGRVDLPDFTNLATSEDIRTGLTSFIRLLRDGRFVFPSLDMVSALPGFSFEPILQLTAKKNSLPSFKDITVNLQAMSLVDIVNLLWANADQILRLISPQYRNFIVLQTQFTQARVAGYYTLYKELLDNVNKLLKEKIRLGQPLTPQEEQQIQNITQNPGARFYESIININQRLEEYIRDPLRYRNTLDSINNEIANYENYIAQNNQITNITQQQQWLRGVTGVLFNIKQFNNLYDKIKNLCHSTEFYTNYLQTNRQRFTEPNDQELLNKADSYSNGILTICSNAANNNTIYNNRYIALNNEFLNILNQKNNEVTTEINAATAIIDPLVNQATLDLQNLTTQVAIQVGNTQTPPPVEVDAAIYDPLLALVNAIRTSNTTVQATILNAQTNLTDTRQLYNRWNSAGSNLSPAKRSELYKQQYKIPYIDPTLTNINNLSGISQQMNTLLTNAQTELAKIRRRGGGIPIQQPTTTGPGATTGGPGATTGGPGATTGPGGPGSTTTSSGTTGATQPITTGGPGSGATQPMTTGGPGSGATQKPTITIPGAGTGLVISPVSSPVSSTPSTPVSSVSTPVSSTASSTPSTPVSSTASSTPSTPVSSVSTPVSSVSTPIVTTVSQDLTNKLNESNTLLQELNELKENYQNFVLNGIPFANSNTAINNSLKLVRAIENINRELISTLQNDTANPILLQSEENVIKAKMNRLTIIYLNLFLISKQNLTMIQVIEQEFNAKKMSSTNADKNRRLQQAKYIQKQWTTGNYDKTFSMNRQSIQKLYNSNPVILQNDYNTIQGVITDTDVNLAEINSIVRLMELEVSKSKLISKAPKQPVDISSLTLPTTATTAVTNPLKQITSQPQAPLKTVPDEIIDDLVKLNKEAVDLIPLINKNASNTRKLNRSNVKYILPQVRSTILRIQERVNRLTEIDAIGEKYVQTIESNPTSKPIQKTRSVKLRDTNKRLLDDSNKTLNELKDLLQELQSKNTSVAPASSQNLSFFKAGQPGIKRPTQTIKKKRQIAIEPNNNNNSNNTSALQIKKSPNASNEGGIGPNLSQFKLRTIAPSPSVTNSSSNANSNTNSNTSLNSEEETISNELNTLVPQLESLLQTNTSTTNLDTQQQLIQEIEELEAELRRIQAQKQGIQIQRTPSNTESIKSTNVQASQDEIQQRLKDFLARRIWSPPVDPQSKKNKQSYGTKQGTYKKQGITGKIGTQKGSLRKKKNRS